MYLAAAAAAHPSKEKHHVIPPFPIVIEGIETTGSAAIDGLGRLSVLLYDLLGGTGSATINAGS